MEKLCAVYVFIDASNVWEVQKAKGRLFDYAKLRDFIRKKFPGFRIQIFYYTAFPVEGSRNYSLDAKHRFYTFLRDRLGFIVRKKKLKRINIITDTGIKILEKGNMDVELTIDVMHHIDKYDIAVLFSGDSDFLALVNHLKRKGKKVYIFSSRNNISEELRTGSNGYTDILNIQDDIWLNNLGRITKPYKK